MVSRGISARPRSRASGSTTSGPSSRWATRSRRSSWGVDRKKRVPSLSIKAKESDEEAQAIHEYTASAPTGATTLGDLIKEQMGSSRTEGTREE